jgi:hypothetical protein
MRSSWSPPSSSSTATSRARAGPSMALPMDGFFDGTTCSGSEKPTPYCLSY